MHSKRNDSVYCLPCILFCKNRKSKLVKLPGFPKLNKIGDKLKNHLIISTHSETMAEASDFKERFEKPSSTLPYKFDNLRAERGQHKREILQWVIETIKLCGKQCIVCRGYRENVASNNTNSEGFLAILKLLALTKSSPNLSPKIQNEITMIIDYDILQVNLISEIKEAKSFSKIADEVESHKAEETSICIRFVNKTIIFESSS